MKQSPLLIPAVILASVLVLVSLFVGWLLGSQAPRLVSLMPTAGSRPGIGMMHGSGSGMMMHAAIESDADFLMQMIPHHEEAVETSLYVLSRTDDPEYQAFLQGIVDAQAREIAQMKAWHLSWFGSEYQDDGRYQPMMPPLQGLKDDRLVAAYLHGMVMHHMGAVDMARQIRVLSEREELLNFADEIIRVQTEEIGWMLSRLRDGFGGGMPMMMH